MREIHATPRRNAQRLASASFLARKIDRAGNEFPILAAFAAHRLLKLYLIITDATHIRVFRNIRSIKNQDV